MSASCPPPGRWCLPVPPTALALVMVAFLTLFGAAPVQAADALAGSYSVQGWDPTEVQPKDRAYSGTATLTRQGEAFRYTGEIDGYKYSGVGIYHPDTKTLALHFKEEKTGKVGVAHFRVSGTQLDGTWVWMDDPKGRQGKEAWIRK